MLPVTQTKDEKVPNVTVVMQPDSQITSKPKQSLFIKRVLVAVLGFAVVAGIVIGCIYFGMTSVRGMKQRMRMRMRFRNRAGQRIDQTITADEEVFETPGITAIFDFSSNRMVYKEADSRVCYVSRFNPDDIQLPGDLFNTQFNSEVKLEFTDSIETKPKTTGKELLLSHLSERGQELCRKMKILLINEDNADI